MALGINLTLQVCHVEVSSPPGISHDVLLMR
jgi:hypothetical protein